MSPARRPMRDETARRAEGMAGHGPDWQEMDSSLSREALSVACAEAQSQEPRARASIGLAGRVRQGSLGARGPAIA
jgi:hypothetical protein